MKGGNMEEIKGFPKFQYSIFLDDKRDEQIVIRTETWEEFLEAKAEVNKILEKRATQNAFSKPVTNTTQPELNEDLGTCSNCGAPNTTYRKSGKVGCSKYCWKK